MFRKCLKKFLMKNDDYLESRCSHFMCRFRKDNNTQHYLLKYLKQGNRFLAQGTLQYNIGAIFKNSFKAKTIFRKVKSLRIFCSMLLIKWKVTCLVDIKEPNEQKFLYLVKYLLWLTAGFCPELFAFQYFRKWYVLLYVLRLLVTMQLTKQYLYARNINVFREN